MMQRIDNACLNLNDVSSTLSVADVVIHFPPVGNAIMFAEAAMDPPLEDV